MSKDVEALFKKINQASLPYKVFETDALADILDAIDAAEPAAASTPEPPKSYAGPQLVAPPAPPPRAEPAVAAAVARAEAALDRAAGRGADSESPRPSSVSRERIGLLRNYAPAATEPEPGHKPLLLKDIFARMANRSGRD